MKYSDIHLSYKKNIIIKYEKYRKYAYFDKNDIETYDLNKNHNRTKKVFL